MNEVKGYKVFNPDWTCRGTQYKVGEEYKYDGDIKLCKSGYHFCTELIDCFRYYYCDFNNKVAEVVAYGDVIYDDDDSKCVTNHIKIVREISWE